MSQPQLVPQWTVGKRFFLPFVAFISIVCVMILHASGNPAQASNTPAPKAPVQKQVATAAAVDIPTVLVRAGNRGVVEPTPWCTDHKALCKDTLTSMFWDKMQENSTNLPTAHEWVNMKRVYINTYNDVPAAKSSKRALTALQAYNAYHDDLVSNPRCHLAFVWGNLQVPGAPVWPTCVQSPWGGNDGTVSTVNGNVDLDDIDKGWIVCETTFLGTAAGTTVFSAGTAAPVSVAIASGGTFGCSVGWITSRFLWGF